MKLPLLLAMSGLALPVCAQIGITFPNQYTLNEGEGQSSLLENVGRTQQILSDFANYTQSIKALYFRRDSTTATNAEYVGRSAEVAISMGRANLAGASATFASNYVDVPVAVFTKKVVNLPSLVDRPRQQPAANEVAFPFDLPFTMVKPGPVLWDLVVSSTSAAGKKYPLDTATASGVAVGRYLMRETGCATTNGTMELRVHETYTSSTQAFFVQWYVQQAPGSVPTVVMVGTSNPALTIPGLCAKLMTNGLVTISGTSNAVGTLSTLAITGTYPNVKWSGVTFECQAAALDASKPGIQASVSNGLYMYVPYAVPTTLDTKIVRAASASAATGTLTSGSAIITHYGY